MAPRTPSPNRPKKAEPYNQFTPLATSFSKTSLLTPGGIRINARIESNKKRFPYPSRIPGPATPSGNTTTANNTGDNTVAALDELDTPSRNPRSKKTKSKCNETPILFPYLIQAEGDITSATTTAAHDKKVIRSWGTKEEEHRHCEDVIPCSNISAHEGAVHFVCNSCASKGNACMHALGIPLLTQGPAFALEGNRFLPLCWGCAEEIVQAEARDKGEMRRGCKCFALDLCFECKLKELEVSAVRRNMAVERQTCVKGTKEAFEILVGCFCGSDDVGGGLRCAGCEEIVCLFEKRAPMDDDVEVETGHFWAGCGFER